jgi:hypothetical protein
VLLLSIANFNHMQLNLAEFEAIQLAKISFDDKLGQRGLSDGW